MSLTGIQDRFVVVQAPAKLNLHLEILGRRTDGYHELETVMVAVSLYDSIRFQASADDRLDVRCFHSASLRAVGCAVPSGPSNLAWNAVDRFRRCGESFGQRRGGVVDIFKRIPDRAGLGGGSSDAAAAILAARSAWGAPLDRMDVVRTAAEVGSDVPFFLESGTSICRGRGERVAPLRQASPLWFVIAKPREGLDTRSVYERSEAPSSPRDSAAICDSIERGTPRQIGRHLFNRLQFAAEALAPEIRHAACEFRRLGCCGHQLSGSGSAYFGLFDGCRAARRGEQILRARLPGWFVVSCRSLAREYPFRHLVSTMQEANSEHH